MRYWSLAAWLGLCLLGCNRSAPYLAAQPAGTVAPASPGLFSAWGPRPSVPIPTDANALATQSSAREAELNRRLQALDENNRQLQTQLAQSQQQLQLAADERTLLRRQLQDVSGQLQESRIAGLQAQDRMQGLTEQMRTAQAASQLRGTARLTANSSLRSGTEGLTPLGFPVFQEGDVIRLRVPADQLFQPNTTVLNPSAAELLDRIAATLKQHYPRQRIGIEGHTDAGPFYGGSYATAQQLSAAQSTAIVEHLQRRNQLPASQLFSLAHGTNHPVADNQTPTGRSQNRRIEFVIYPDTY